MTRRFSTLAWSAAVSTYLLIVLGAVVRITGSGMGCGDHWPLCNGHLFPPLDDIGTVIEWSHRLVATLVSVLVIGLAAYSWRLRRLPPPSAALRRPNRMPYAALGLLIVQILLGAITVKLELPAWSIVLHLGTAMLLLATLLAAASVRSPSPERRGGQGVRTLIPLAFVTVLFGALTANLGAAAACHGFPLCNGEIWISAGPLAWIQWLHRLLAYSLAIGAAIWALRTPGAAPKAVLGLVVLQVALGAATVLLGLPSGLQAAHVAVGAAVWTGIVIAYRQNDARPEQPAPGAPSDRASKSLS